MLSALHIAVSSLDPCIVDGSIAKDLQDLSEWAVIYLTLDAQRCTVGVSFGMGSPLIILLIFTPVYLFPAFAIAAAGACIGQVYVKAQLSVKREMSVAKAPVLGILGGAVTGLCTLT